MAGQAIMFIWLVQTDNLTQLLKCTGKYCITCYEGITDNIFFWSTGSKDKNLTALVNIFPIIFLT